MSRRTKIAISVALVAVTGFAIFFFRPTEQPVAQTETLLGAAPSALRQEVNITDAYLYSASGSYATSSEIIQVASTSYNGATAYFEVVASTTGATTATIKLVNATSSAVVKSINIDGGNTYSRYRSTSFTMPDTATEYKVVLGNEAIGKGLLASRVVILQSGTITNTETQIEIGSATTSAINTATLPLQDPKYWYYNSTYWDASPTFYAEATYQVAPVASSTTYAASATTTSTFYSYVPSLGAGYVAVEAWGPGGGGDGVTSAATLGGGGGGGGAYARSTTTPAVGSTNIIGVGRGGAEGVTTTASSTLTGTGGVILVQAAGGTGANTGTGGPGGTTANSTGDVEFAGGSGGDGETTVDTGGAGGGSAGPDGAGITPANATNGVPVAGGNGDNNLGGAGGAAGTGADDTCDTENGKPGANHVKGGGGGGGGDGDVTSICTGGNGGKPGGGGGGSDEGGDASNQVGGPGQVKLTEWIGTVGVALQEDDGNFGSWTFKAQIITAGKTSTTTERIRSAAFTPTSGKHYRIVASSTNATAPYSIYNAKIVVDQAGGTVTVDTYNESNRDDFSGINGSTATGVGQSFTVSSAVTLSSAVFYLAQVSPPTGTVVAKIYNYTGTPGTDAKPTGAALATSDAFDVSPLTGSFVLVTFPFSGAAQISLTANTNYIVTIENATLSAGAVSVGRDLSSPTHSGNRSTLVSGTWSTGTDYDFIFYVKGTTPNPTLLEPQYLLAPFKLPAGTALQNFLTLFDPAEWSGSTNTYLLDVDAADNSTSVITLRDNPFTTTYATVSSPDNEATSTLTCLPSASTTWDTQATTNNSDIYAVRVLAQVGGSQTSTCSSGPTPNTPHTIIQGQTVIQGQVIIP